MSRGFPNVTSAQRNCIAALLLIGVATPPRQALTPEQSSYATRAAKQIVLSVDPARIEAWNPL